ncbi:hypothetical protein V7S43_001136 [Phytophthora oleae]|uniref:Elicitin-like protein n=1 Tax=Phytophthora oleae TaxID=2107226 RepID=A0ABD3G4L9_9STRA
MQVHMLKALVAIAAALCGVKACDGFFQLRFSLKTNERGLADSLRECVAPLLFAPVQWLPGDQAREFCTQEACKRAVQELKKIPSCTWKSEIPSGSDANTLAIAQQVMRDCGDVA